MLYRYVTIVRDSNTRYYKEVMPWEIAILRAVFDDESVIEHKGKFKLTAAPTPKAVDEYQRLGKVYGKDGASGMPYVCAAYPEQADFEAAVRVPLWARVGIWALGKLESFKPRPAPTEPIIESVSYTQKGFTDHRAGMLAAINDSLRTVAYHDAERERFKRE